MSDQLNTFDDFNIGVVAPDLIVKQFDSNKIRIVDIDGGGPWFVAKDVCVILGIKNPSDALKVLDDEERARFNLGRQGETNIINESGLYNFILQSRKPETKRFKKWVTSEVIPSIRKTGKYSISNPPLLPDFTDPVAAARAWADAKEAELKANQKLIEAKPKIEFYNQVGDSKGLHTVAEAAKMLGTGRNRLFSWMRSYKILRANNEPYQKYIEAGYFEVKESPDDNHVHTQTFVTPSGLQWLQKLREKNLIQMKEWAKQNDILKVTEWMKDWDDGRYSDELKLD